MWLKEMQVLTNIPPDTAPPSHAVLPHSNSVPNLTTHQVIAQEPWIRNTPEATIYKNTPFSLTHLYQISHNCVKENFEKISAKSKNT